MARNNQWNSFSSIIDTWSLNPLTLNPNHSFSPLLVSGLALVHASNSIPHVPDHRREDEDTEEEGDAREDVLYRGVRVLRAPDRGEGEEGPVETLQILPVGIRL